MNQQSIRPRQASPLSMQSDSSILNRYQSTADALNSRSPPFPQDTGDASRPPSHRSPGGSHSSDGAGLRSPVMSDSGRSGSSRHSEDALRVHFSCLKDYLNTYLQSASTRPTRARDKLLRLSFSQFNELSTDVYDELRRREDFRIRRGEGVPRSLPPKNTFHPKRNQARQKLSTLPPERFKQLAADVYFELERRIPHVNGGPRSASPAMSQASSMGPGRGPPGVNRPPGAGPYSARSASNDYGRPLPRTFQSNTLVPNKSTMIEDDESDDDDPMGIVNDLTKRSTMKSSESDQENIRALESQIAELQGKFASMENQVQQKDADIEKMETTRRERELDFSSERDGWTSSRNDLERRLAELQGTAEAHNAEIDRTHQNHSKREAGLRDQMEQTVNEMQSQLDNLHQENTMLRLQGGSNDRDESPSEWQERCRMLEAELTRQQKVTEEVRQSASDFLQEMRELSQQSEAALEKEDELRNHISGLEKEVNEWKARYAKTKTQLRTLKASSIGLPLQRMAGDALSSRQELLSHNGVVHDVDVTSFQISIDELLHAARQSSGDDTLDKMKIVVNHVQQITGPETNGHFTGLLSPSSSPHLGDSPDLNGGAPTPSALKARVTRNANGLITATRNYVSSNGLSPVSLLDAAAANLTAAVIDYLKTVGIKASTAQDLQHEGGEQDYGEEGDYETLAPKTHSPEQPVKMGTDHQQHQYQHQQHSRTNGGGGGGAGGAGGWFSRLKGSFDSSYSEENGVTALHDGDESEEEDTYDAYR